MKLANAAISLMHVCSLNAHKNEENKEKILNPTTSLYWNFQKYIKFVNAAVSYISAVFSSSSKDFFSALFLIVPEEILIGAYSVREFFLGICQTVANETGNRIKLKSKCDLWCDNLSLVKIFKCLIKPDV